MEWGWGCFIDKVLSKLFDSPRFGSLSPCVRASFRGSSSLSIRLFILRHYSSVLGHPLLLEIAAQHSPLGEFDRPR